MIKNITLRNYRAFERYSLTELKRVNLLVGKNNCGKTSVLEGIYFAGSRGDLRALKRIALSRGEVLAKRDEFEGYASGSHPLVTHFFHGHSFHDGSSFSIEPQGSLPPIRLTVQAPSEPTDSLFPDSLEQEMGSVYELALDGASSFCETLAKNIPVSSEGAISLRSMHYALRRASAGHESRESSVPMEFLTAESLDGDTMHEMWNEALIDGLEGLAVEFLQIIEPRLRGVYFLSGRIRGRSEQVAPIVASIEGAKKRVPLGSMGDGMRRLLALSLALIGSRAGIQLVDEIDTGLHYSSLPQMWRLVIETAMKADTQVFATTHSWDCLEALSAVCEDAPELRDQISVQKLDTRLEESVSLHADNLMTAVEQGIELR